MFCFPEGLGVDNQKNVVVEVLPIGANGRLKAALRDSSAGKRKLLTVYAKDEEGKN